MAARNYSNTAIQTTLSSGINSSTTSVLVAATTGFPSVPFIVALDAGAAAQELVLVTAVAGTNLTVTRGYDGTTAVSHDAGAVVQHAHAAIEFREANEHVQATAAHGATGAVVGTTNTQTLSNKTIALGSNTVSGTKAQFSTAITDGDLPSGDIVGTSDTQTLTNKTLALGSNTVSGTKAQFDTACTDADFATLAAAETLTNKTIALGSNTVSGTTAQFNAANTDGDFATLAGTETLTNKTLTSTTNTFPAEADQLLRDGGGSSVGTTESTVDWVSGSQTGITYDTGTDEATIATTGLYLIHAHVDFADSGSRQAPTFSIEVNGVEAADTKGGTTAAATTITLPVTHVKVLTAGDVVRCRIKADTSGGTYFSGEFQIVRLA